jgi:hypothetical protein
MHPGPINRGVEIDSAVADGSAQRDPAAGHLRHRGAHGRDVDHCRQRGMKILIRNGRVVDPASGRDERPTSPLPRPHRRPSARAPTSAPSA